MLVLASASKENSQLLYTEKRVVKSESEKSSELEGRIYVGWTFNAWRC
jgi:hypothetical protein